MSTSRREIVEPSVFEVSEEPKWKFQGNTLVMEGDPTEPAVKHALEKVNTMPALIHRKNVTLCLHGHAYQDRK